MRRSWIRVLAPVSAVLAAAAVAGVPPATAEVFVPSAPFGVPTPVAGDFTGDGRTDIALTGAAGWNMIAVATSTASGFTTSFAPAPVFAAAAATPGVKIVTGDVDGDQDDDMILVGATTLTVARSNGNGTFAVSSTAAGSFPQLAAQPSVRLHAHDFNGDGSVDLALTGGGLTTIPIAFSAGNATFTVANHPAPEFTQQVAASHVQVLTGDFDADGRTDFAAVPIGRAPVNDRIVLARSNGDGTFRPASVPQPDFLDQIGDAGIMAADFNDDGRTDLAVATRFLIRIAYAQGDGSTFDLHLEAEASVDFAIQAMKPNARFLAGDYNCDGREDIAVLPGATNAWSTILVAMSTTDPDVLSVMESPDQQFLSLATTSGAKPLPGDYNDDGCADFALSGGAGWTSVPIAAFTEDGFYFLQHRSAPDFATWAAGARPATFPSTAPPSTLGNLNVPEIAGIDSSTAIGTDGLPIIAYFLSGAGDLQVAHCADVACTAFTHVSSIDTAGTVGEFSSIKIGADGLPLISYVANTNSANSQINDLKMAHCDNIVCTSATVTTLDAPSQVALPTALTIGADGLGLVAYQDRPGTTVRIKVAHCRDVTCSSADVNLLDTTRSFGAFHEFNNPSQLGFVTGTHGFGVLSYYDPEFANLKLATCLDAICSTRHATVVDTATLGGASVTIGLDGLPLVSYRVGQSGNTSSFHLKVAHCQNPLCTARTVVTADANGGVGNKTAITIGGDGFGVVSYYDLTNQDLKLIHCANVTCDATTATTVDAIDDLGSQATTITGTDGLPLITYLGPGTTGSVLRVLHCGSSDCTAPIVAPF